MQPNYRADIDGLRALAVLAVVTFHAFPGKITGGFIGVDIFFVISGFLITSIIYQAVKADNFSFFDFYTRRIKRIFPSLLLILISIIFFGWFFLLSSEYEELGKHIFAGSIFSSNFVLWSESDYFDVAAETKPLLHLWSLGIEEQFYIVWPLTIYCIFKARVNLKWFVLFVFIASFLYCVWQTYFDVTAAFYSPLSRFWELLTGSILAIFLSKQYLNIPIWVSNIFLSTGLLAIFFGIFNFTSFSLFPGWLALLPTLGAAFVIFSNPTTALNRAILSNRVIVWFGLISFPLYLWHWPILSLIRIINGGKPSILIRLFAILAAIILSWLSYELLEKPIRFKIKNRLVLPILIFSMIAVGVFGISAVINHGYRNRSVLDNVTVNSNVIDQLVGSKWKYTNNNACLAKYASTKALPNSIVWNFCIQNSDNDPTILLLGNSLANQLYPGFVQNSKLKHNRILSIGSFNASGFEPDNPRLVRTIDDERLFINNLIRNTVTLKYVVLSGIDVAPNNEYINHLVDRIDLIEKAGIQVIIFTPHMKLLFEPKYCFSRPFVEQTKSCDFSPEVRDGQMAYFDPVVKAISKMHPNVLFFDPTQLYCNAVNCSYVKDGMPLFRDKVHLSEFGSIQLSNLFVKWSEKNLPGILNVN